MADEVTRVTRRENGRSFCSDSIVSCAILFEERVNSKEGLNNGGRAVTFRRQQLKGSKRPRRPVGLMCSTGENYQVADSLGCSCSSTTHELAEEEENGLLLGVGE